MQSVPELAEPAETISGEAALSKALWSIRSSKLRAVVALNGDKSIAGVIDGRCLLDFHENADLTKCHSVAQKTPVVSDETTPEELVAYFLNTHARVLPFVKKGVLKGVVSRTSCLKLLLEASAAREGRVADFMVRKEVSVPEETIVQSARKKMRELGVYHLAVTDSRGRLSGVVSSYDIAVNVIPHQRESFRQGTFAPTPETGVENEPVSSIMNSVPEVVAPGASLKQAIGQMLSANVAALVVVDGEKPVGLLSVRDCLHAVLKPAAEPVMVYGLREDEKSMAESIKQLGAEFLAKLDKKMVADYLALHVKSFKEGKKRRYAVKGKLCVRGRLLTATTPETSAHKSVWDLHASVKEVLDELSRITSEMHDKPRAKKRHHGGVEE